MGHCSACNLRAGAALRWKSPSSLRIGRKRNEPAGSKCPSDRTLALRLPRDLLKALQAFRWLRCTCPVRRTCVTVWEDADDVNPELSWVAQMSAPSRCAMTPPRAEGPSAAGRRPPGSRARSRPRGSPCAVSSSAPRVAPFHPWSRYVSTSRPRLTELSELVTVEKLVERAATDAENASRSGSIPAAACQSSANAIDLGAVLALA